MSKKDKTEAVKQEYIKKYTDMALSCAPADVEKAKQALLGVQRYVEKDSKTPKVFKDIYIEKDVSSVVRRIGQVFYKTDSPTREQRKEIADHAHPASFGAHWLGHYAFKVEQEGKSDDGLLPVAQAVAEELSYYWLSLDGTWAVGLVKPDFISVIDDKIQNPDGPTIKFGDNVAYHIDGQSFTNEAQFLLYMIEKKAGKLDEDDE
jgi:hypothetical protein